MNISSLQNSYSFSSNNATKTPSFKGGIIADDKTYTALMEQSRNFVYGEDFQKAFSRLVDTVKNFTFNVKLELLNKGVTVSKVLPGDKTELISFDTVDINRSIRKACDKLLDTAC